MDHPLPLHYRHSFEEQASMLLDLVVRTLQGSCWVRSLHPSLTIDELKRLLYETVHVDDINIPKPENQNLVRAVLQSCH